MSSQRNNLKENASSDVDLGVVVVDYKSSDRTIEYVNTELSKISTEVRIVIVNNSCTDETNASLAKGCGGKIVDSQMNIESDDRVFIIGAEENLGYARGNNVGARFLSRHFGIRYILFSNNDLRFIDEDVVEQLIGTLVRHENAGAVGPRVVDPQGSDQSPKKEMNIWQRIVVSAGCWPFLGLFFRKGFLSDTLQNAPFGQYYTVMGCFFIVEANTFAAVEGFDEGTFLYAEETILSERMKGHGKRIYYNPAAEVVHEHGQVVSKHMMGMQSMRLRLESEFYYYKKYKDISAFEKISAGYALAIFSNLYLPLVMTFRRAIGSLVRGK